MPVVGGVVVEVVGCEVPDPAVVAGGGVGGGGRGGGGGPLVRRAIQALTEGLRAARRLHRPTDSMAAVRPQEVKSSREICPTARPTQQAAVNIPARRFPAFL